MAAKDPALRKQIAALGGRARRPDKYPNVDDERRALKASRAEEYIRALVDSAPPLTDEQRDRLALLLRGSVA